MINPKVRKQFLSRKLDNWDWLKREKPKDVTRALMTLDPAPDFGEVKLWLHQKVAFLIVVFLKRMMLFLDMGGGKTLLVLMLLKYLKQMGEKPKAIVFVPYVITTETWLEETEKWTDLVCVPLIYSGKENLELLKNEEADLFVVAYQSGVAMFAKKKRNTDPKTKKKIDWELTAADVRKHTKGINVLVMDEIHKCKNVQSMTYRMCRAISKECEWALGLTGTPFGRDLQDLWAQFYLIDFGETLGATLGFFRSVFFNEKAGFFGGWEYSFKKTLMPTLKKVIKHRSIRYTIDECHDMPKKKYIKKYVRANDQIITYYNKMVEHLEGLSFGKVKFQELESAFMKLKQLSSGFMTFKGDDNTKVEVNIPDNPKLDALQELVEEMPEDSKMIVFHDFVHTNDLISERLKQMKIPHARVWGKGKKNIQEIRKFKRDPKCRVMVINCQSGSSSQNLQVANYIVYFEQPRSAIDREQSERRAWRPGQTKRVFIIDLIMKGTTDIKQHSFNRQGKNLLKKVLDKGTGKLVRKL